METHSVAGGLCNAPPAVAAGDIASGSWPKLYIASAIKVSGPNFQNVLIFKTLSFLKGIIIFLNP